MDTSVISEQASALVASIRDHVRSQKELWQQVPWLALQADGRAGYSGLNGRAYRTGYWAVKANRESGSYSVYVDCATGELVNAWAPERLALDFEVAKFAFDMDQFNVAALLEEFKLDARRERHRAIEQKPDFWREDLAERLGLEKVYVRRKKSA